MLYGLSFLTCMVANPTHGDRWRVARFRCGSPPKDDGTRI